MGLNEYERKHNKLLRKYGAECTVLLKKDGHFPIKAGGDVYVSIPEGKLDESYQVLAGFAKTNELKPGELEETGIEFSLADIAPFSPTDSAYILEAGDYVIRVGNSSRDTNPCAIIRLSAEAVTKKVRSVVASPDFEDWRPDKESKPKESKPKESIDLNVPVINVNSEDIETQTVVYDKEYEIDESLKSMPVEKLIKTSIGAFDEKNAGLLSIIGNAGSSVAGAAGQSCLEAEDYGISSLVMADGPAGLRLTKHYVEDEKGIHGIGEMAIPETMLELLPKAGRKVMKFMSYKHKRGAVIKHQYATAML